ncbi:ceramide synthase 5-like [Babylonia areolata]|uniref:ceramide synthase 5-like n=1 Tax=Babylonia areolata TaxID=304850 RepID=UPI003FD30CB0
MVEKQLSTAPHNPALETEYSREKSPSDETLERLSKQTDLRVRQIERWFRIRRNQDRTPVLKKFCESSWRCTYYAVIFCYGLYTLWDKPWLWDTSYCWKGWPEHHVSNDVYWYYSVQAGFYMALSLSLFTDHKRKDFTEMIVHHFATLGLMFLSWMVNFTRVGTLVLLVHDCVDPIMEAAKMAKYVKKETLCTSLFVCFMLTWVLTRMMLFPFRIIRSTLFESGPYTGEFYMYYTFNVLLIVLQVLHIIWFYFILLIAKDGLFEGQLKKDSRSSDESVSEDDDAQTGIKGTVMEAAADKNGLKMLDQNGLSAHKISRK